MPDWILYGTVGCHLCEQAAALVGPALARRGNDWLEADIADDELLMARYGVRIPVLRHQPSGAELGWPFDAGDLGRWLDRINQPDLPAS